MTLVNRRKTAQRTTTQTVPYSQRPDLLATDPGTNQGTTAAETRRFLIDYYKGRVRQAGTVTGCRMWSGTDIASANFSEIRIQIWRKDGATYDLVGESENFETTWDDVTATTLNIITFSTPITGVQEGDYVCLKLSSTSAAVGSIVRGENPSDAGAGVSLQLVGSVGTTDVDFDAGTAGNAYPVIEIIGDNPEIICIGSSLTEGSTFNSSFISGGTTHDPTKSYPNKLGTLLGVSIQNMGITTVTTSAAALARFDDDVIAQHPKACVIEVGTNQISQGIDLEPDTYRRHLQSMINKCISDGITPILCTIPPRDDFTASENHKRDEFNLIIKNFEADDILVVDLDPILGTFSSSGPAGNYWSMLYDGGDNIHLSEAGYTAMAGAIRDTINTRPDIIDVNFDTVMTTKQIDAVISPPEGISLYDDTLNKRKFYNGTSWVTTT